MAEDRGTIVVLSSNAACQPTVTSFLCCVELIFSDLIRKCRARRISYQVLSGSTCTDLYTCKRFYRSVAK